MNTVKEWEIEISSWLTVMVVKTVISYTFTATDCEVAIFSLYSKSVLLCYRLSYHLLLYLNHYRSTVLL